MIEENGWNSYLEIGCAGNHNFDQVQSQHKVGVDPHRGGTLRLTSDAFFRINQERFDLVFIDGLHLKEQVLKDVDNALAILKEGGIILLHDCLPTQEFHQFRKPTPGKGAWTGDVWKAVVELRTRSDVDIAVLDCDWGLGVVRRTPNSARLLPDESTNLNWQEYTERRNWLLRVLPIHAFLEWLSSPKEGRSIGGPSVTGQT